MNKFNSNDELKQFFNFLGGNTNSNLLLDNFKLTQILFGLENSGLKIDEDHLRKLKENIEKNSRDGKVNFEDFKAFWTTEFENRNSSKEISNYLFNIINELLDKEEKGNNLKVEDIYDLLCFLNVSSNADEIKSTKGTQNNILIDKNSLTSKETEKLKYLAREMVDCIDLDGDKEISLKDFEFLITEYLNRSKQY